ncbi:MAG: carboxypeptidase regulatory-like domain-containing protein [Candidatus Kerfeldbacteria bacterium]|nr:carboxypeptidase regulatory-like domain-containing protein [Candidatus Kerfeldbacteria bacterium]
MDIKLRRGLYLSFILAFIVLSPIILGYARGYRYSFQQKRIVQTGIAILESQPSNANIVIDDQPTDMRTLATIKNLRPNDYVFTVRKDGYAPWSKKLTISAGAATIADRITLFREQPEQKNVRDDLLTLALRSRREEILYTVKREDGATELHRYHTGSASDILIYETLDPIESYTLSRHGTAVLISQTPAVGNPRVIVQNTYRPSDNIPLSDLVDVPILTTRWSEDSDDVVFVRSAEKSFIANLSTRRVLELDLKEFENAVYFLTHVHLYTVQNGVLTMINTEDQKRQILSEGITGSISTCPYSSDRLAISSLKNQKFMILTDLENSPKIHTLDQRVTGCEWSHDGSELLFWNEFEIGVYSIKTRVTEILNRVSTPIRLVQFFPNEFAVVVLTEDGTVSALERDGRDRRNHSVLGEDVDFFTLSNDGKSLFVERKDDATGFLSLESLTIQ